MIKHILSREWNFSILIFQNHKNKDSEIFRFQSNRSSLGQLPVRYRTALYSTGSTGTGTVRTVLPQRRLCTVTVGDLCFGGHET